MRRNQVCFEVQSPWIHDGCRLTSAFGVNDSERDKRFARSHRCPVKIDSLRPLNCFHAGTIVTLSSVPSSPLAMSRQNLLETLLKDILYNLDIPDTELESALNHATGDIFDLDKDDYFEAVNDLMREWGGPDGLREKWIQD